MSTEFTIIRILDGIDFVLKAEQLPWSPGKGWQRPSHPGHNPKDRIYVGTKKAPLGVPVYVGDREGKYWLQTDAKKIALIQTKTGIESRMRKKLGEEAFESFISGWDERREKRQGYAKQNLDQYETFVENVRESDIPDIRKAEFALLSARADFTKSTVAWQMTDGVDDPNELEAIFLGKTSRGKDSTIGLPIMRTANLRLLRNKNKEDGTVPIGNREARQSTKFPGLGLPKYSFAACLIEGSKSEIVCLDTHMMQIYTGYDGKQMAGSKAMYEQLENHALMEAKQIGMSPFAYQWAVWDHKRGKQEKHDFLWTPRKHAR
jgi:hypothetical protein